MALPATASNALLVSGRESASGHPLMVAGPQVAYFNPQILMEQDVHAPAQRGPPADRRPRRELHRRQPLRPARPRSRLRLERHVGGPGQHRHVRAEAVRRHALPLSRRVRADRGAREDRLVVADAGGPDARRLADAARRAHQARARGRARDDPRQAGDLHETALDLLPRGRLGGGLHGLQHADGDHRAGVVPAGGEQDRLHVQLVLRRLREDLLLQLGREPRAGQADRPRPPGRRSLRVARLGPGRLEVRTSRRRRRTRR